MQLTFRLTPLTSAAIFWTISGSHNVGSQLLQNTEIIKQTDALLWKIKRIYGSVSYLFSCTVGLNVTCCPLLYYYHLLGSTTPLLLYFWLTLSPWVQDSSAWGCDECTMQFIVYCVSNFETWGILSFILTLLKVTMSDDWNYFEEKSKQKTEKM